MSFPRHDINRLIRAHQERIAKGIDAGLYPLAMLRTAIYPAGTTAISSQDWRRERSGCQE